MLDKEGYRPCVGILLTDGHRRLFWGKRSRGAGWQFPQGGLRPGETAEAALWRELREEVGLRPGQAKILAQTRGWLQYDVPAEMQHHDGDPHFKGQRQKWFLLLLLSGEESIRLADAPEPEFSHWEWIGWWMDLHRAVPFKRGVYRQALAELAAAAGAGSAPRGWGQCPPPREAFPRRPYRTVR